MQDLESIEPRPEGHFRFDKNEVPLPDQDDGFWNYIDHHPLSPLLEGLPGELDIPGGNSSGSVTEDAAGSYQSPVWDKTQNILYDLAEDESGPLIVQESSSPKANVPECANRSEWTPMQNLLYDLEKKPANLTRSSIHDPSIESSTPAAVPAASPEEFNTPQKAEFDNRPVWEAMGDILRNLK
ncbi:hypothetical protein L486_04580 [Kwoniella mangroviensis CBS 10435]|uniref:Uncharacterized protein n=1 Tax=Kwoniella mangroviensis CBS 10435 TaxID=1331196 RepID=A0A1B9ISP5_9TREE|nr:hypothetical protein L486_04580 [Kwoniella mangroviensis CBS 10435]